MSAGKRPSVDAALGVAAFGMAALGVLAFGVAALGVLASGVAALGVLASGVAAEVVGEAVNKTNANAKPGADRSGLSQLIRPAWRLRCGSGLRERKVCVFIFMLLKLRKRQFGLTSAPDVLALGDVISPATGAGIAPPAVVGEPGIPNAGGAGITGRATGKLS